MRNPGGRADGVLPSELSTSASRNTTTSSRRRSAISTRHILQRLGEFRFSDAVLDEREQWTRERVEVDEALGRLASASRNLTYWQALRESISVPSSVGQFDALKRDWETAVRFHAPRRASLPVYITDFGLDSARHDTDTVGNIERCK